MKKVNIKNSSPLNAGCFLLAFILTCFSLNSCKKYLEAKPDQSIATPSTISDLLGILNSYNYMNGSYPSASEVSSDDYFLTTSSYDKLGDPQREYYLWQKYDQFLGDYTAPYQAIEYANVILDALPNIQDGDAATRNMVKGNALFVRAAHHYALAQLYAKPYEKSSADNDPGIVLRMTSDIQAKSTRSTVSGTYSSIITDLRQSLTLVPVQSAYKYQVSKAAVYGFIARVYLSMSDYNNAGLYADSALNLYNNLMNLNNLNPAAAIPFQQFNDDVIYDARASAASGTDPSIAKIDTDLYASYDVNDLRKVLYFKTNADGSHAFKGSYEGQRTAYLFTGVATDELLLIKAETADRANNVTDALNALNTLLVTRYKTGTFAPYTITDNRALLKIILQERRKELTFRTLRWTDLRRLNQDPGFAKTLVRIINGTTYQLQPNGVRYVFLLDSRTITIGGVAQNP
jgi:hypothetical protein